MHANADDLALLADGHDDEIERNPTMDRRLALGLGHQWHVAALLEIAHRAEATALVRRSAGNAEDAERARRRLVWLFHMIAEQGHRAVGEPIEKGRAFRVVDQLRILAHAALQCLPVAHREAHVFEHTPKIRGEFLPAARVGAVQLQIHHQFAPRFVSAGRLDRNQLALGIAANGDDRMEQPMDGELTRGDRIADKVDEEWHIVVDDPDPHPPVAGVAADRLDLQCELTWPALGSDASEEFRGLPLRLSTRVHGSRPGRAFPVSAFRINSTSGGSRRVWAVMKRLCSANEDAAGL